MCWWAAPVFYWLLHAWGGMNTGRSAHLALLPTLSPPSCMDRVGKSIGSRMNVAFLRSNRGQRGSRQNERAHRHVAPPRPAPHARNRCPLLPVLLVTGDFCSLLSVMRMPLGVGCIKTGRGTETPSCLASSPLLDGVSGPQRRRPANPVHGACTRHVHVHMTTPGSISPLSMYGSWHADRAQGKAARERKHKGVGTVHA